MKQEFREKRSHGTPAFPLQVYSHHDKDGFYFVSQHWHDEVECVYVDTGVLRVTIHGTAFQMNPGQFCFVNSGELHEIRSTGESLHHAIVFHPDFLNFSLYDACQHSFIQPITSQKLMFPTVCSSQSAQYQEEILTHMRAIAELYHAPPAWAALSIKLRLLQMIEALFQAGEFSENKATQKEKKSLEQLKKVIEYIHQNYADQISLKTLADITYMSPNYFCHYFRQEIGKSPIHFINEYRIQTAAKLLAETTLPISQISSSVGFDNFSYFIRKFREYKGVTPTQYRSCLD